MLNSLEKKLKNSKNLVSAMFASISLLFFFSNLLLMATFGMKKAGEIYKGKGTIQIGHHKEKRPTILYCSDNKYFSHFAFSIELANRLKDEYIVHFLVLDHTPQKDEHDDLYAKLAKEILLIRVPIDGKFLHDNFLKYVQGGFTNWRRDEIRSQNPDLWILEEMNTLNMYQAVAVHNPIKMKRGAMEKGEKKNVLDWLREQEYSLGMAEWGRLTAAFQIFHELGIERMVATAAPVVNPAFYHFLQMPIPLAIPEFFSAQPKGEEFSLERNKAEYELVIGKYEEIFFNKNVDFYKGLREKALREKGIHLKETPSLGEMLRKCRALLVNQPSAKMDFPWAKPPMVRHIGGIGINHMELYAAKVLGDEGKYRAEMAKIDAHKLWHPNEKCVVLFSLGTIVDFNGFREADLEAMLDAFAKNEECKFLVRFDTEKFEVKNRTPKNVKFIDFHTKIAQQEILAQQNIRALIAQGGQNTFNEAVYAGAPLIVFPFFYDQPYNAALVEHLGIGIYVKPKQFAEKFPKALADIIHKEKYSNKAKEIARQLHQQPQKPMDTFRHTIKEALESEGPPAEDLPPFKHEIQFEMPKEE